MGFSGSRGPRGQHLPGTVANDLIQQRPMTSRLVVGLGAIVNYREHGRTLPASAPKPVLIRATGLSDHPREGAPTFTPPHRGSSSGTDHCSAAESPMSSARNPVSTQSKGWRIGSRSRPDGHDLGTLAVALYWRVPVSESTRSWSRVGVIQFQLMLQATGVWLHLQTAAYSAGVR